MLGLYPRAAPGPSLSSRAERIEQAKADWKAGRVDTVPGDAEEFISLPEADKVSRYPVVPAEIISVTATASPERPMIEIGP